MAEDDKPGTNLASSGVVVAALAAIGAYYFHREAPLVDLRPVVEATLQERTAPQTVVARLWQDPFSAVRKSLDKRGKQDPEQQCGQDPKPEVCKAPLEEGDQDTLVVGVTVPGGPYPEDVERRRRTRYAVLAGLKQAGFVPKDALHIDYFIWQERTQHPSSVPIALNESAVLSPEVSWLKLGLASQLPASEFPPVLLPKSLADKAGSDRDNTTASASSQPTIIPYESFGKPPKASMGTRQSILVLWLREDALRDKPLTSFSSLIGFLHRDRVNGRNVNIVGPFSSTVLHDMVAEVSDVEFQKGKWPQLENVTFYAYGASTSDNQLLETLSNHCQSVQCYLGQYNIHLKRTVATDDTLADGIVSELRRRGVNPDPARKDHVALISEWDTFYGQTLPEAVERKLAPNDAPHHPWIHKFTYLRGLDGLLPSGEGKEDTKQDKTSGSGEKQGSATEFFKIETDTQSLERPIGESQFDYLRRISEHLHKVEHDLRIERPDKKIKAIGILGGDVFDKLLILRALRLEFPEALFFTTDFDEAFTIKSELPFTRNLIVSSSFGLNLSDWLQGEIPSFRDTYETSAFLATQLAAGKFAGDISEQLKAPRVFEVERTGDVLSFAWDGPAPAPASKHHDEEHEDNRVVAGNPTKEGRSSATAKALESDKEWPCLKENDETNCGYIQPIDFEDLKGLARSDGPQSSDLNGPKTIEKLFPTYEPHSRIKLAVSLALGALIGLGLLCFPKVRRNAWVEVSLGALGLAAGSLICFHWEAVAQFLTEKGNGEPLVMLEGVSVWPTILLRDVGIVLSLYFVWRVLRSLHGNLTEIATEMELKPEPAPLWKQFTGIQEDVLTLWKTLTGVFDFSRRNDHAAQSLPLNIEAAWQAYVARERFWPRCIRAALYTAGMFQFAVHVLIPMFGKPITPARGELAYSFYMGTTYSEVILMQFLTFFVFDATLFCLLFVNKLRAVRSEWPEQTLGVYNGRLRLQTKCDDSQLVHDWIDLDFVAKRTRCIGALIYFPFVLIALLILSRSTVFANYAPSLTILIAQGISLAIVFACAIMLWWAAKTARDTAKQNLTDGIIRAKDCEGNACFAGQLESLIHRVDQLKEGAFGPLTQQPLIKALLFPLSSVGWIALIENGMFPGV